MAKVFRSVSAQPAYGQNKVVVTWTLDPDYEQGDIYVYRSPTGIATSSDWEILNPDDPVQSGLGFFTDTEMTDNSLFRYWHYRLLLELGSEEHDSEIVGMFSEDFNPTEFGALYTMRRSEYLRMRVGNGIRIFHAIPAFSGDRTASYDTQLEKDLQRCSGGDGYGTGWTPGYPNVIQTYAEMLAAGDEKTTQDPEGIGFTQDQVCRFRLLAFPRPDTGHLIILPQSDVRYVITDTVSPYLFKGHLPVAWEVNASPLKKDDIRYKLEVPDLVPDQEYPVVFNKAL